MDPLFKVHMLNAVGKAKAMEIADTFDDALKRIRPHCEFNAGREWALVRTYLELASFYAKKAMAQQHENQEGVELKRDTLPLEMEKDPLQRNAPPHPRATTEEG